MSWFRKYPFFAIGLTLCGVVAAGELALIFERFTATREAAKRLEQRRAEVEAMAQLTPPPTREVAAAIEADLAKALKSLAAMQGELTGHGPAAERLLTAKVPVARTDAFFDLATYGEKMKELAEKDGVEVRPEAARFGFSLYANEGPEIERIEPVFRQRLIAEYLLVALLEARPRALFSMKRERTMTKAERQARIASQSGGEVVDVPTSEVESESSDFFEIDPRASAKVPNHIDTEAFRFVFTGQTAALRNFLNRIASFELPVVVREVEVDTATQEEMAPPAAAESVDSAEPGAEASPPVVLTTEPVVPAKEAPPARAPRVPTATPIVLKSVSKYTVTVEFIELVTAPPSPVEEQPAPPTP